MKLNLGCGGTHLDGYVNVDINPACKPDAVMDLTKDSLVRRFGPDSVDEIFSSHALEHITPIVPLLLEMWTVSKPGAIWNIHVPNAPYEIGNPYHVTLFTEWTFRFFEPAVRFVHPLWGNIARGTASEMNPIQLEEIAQVCAHGSIHFTLKVIK